MFVVTSRGLVSLLWAKKVEIEPMGSRWGVWALMHDGEWVLLSSHSTKNAAEAELKRLARLSFRGA